MPFPENGPRTNEANSWQAHGPWTTTTRNLAPGWQDAEPGATVMDDAVHSLLQACARAAWCCRADSLDSGEHWRFWPPVGFKTRRSATRQMHAFRRWTRVTLDQPGHVSWALGFPAGGQFQVVRQRSRRPLKTLALPFSHSSVRVHPVPKSVVHVRARSWRKMAPPSRLDLGLRPTHSARATTFWRKTSTWRAWRTVS